MEVNLKCWPYTEPSCMRADNIVAKAHSPNLRLNIENL